MGVSKQQRPALFAKKETHAFHTILNMHAVHKIYCEGQQKNIMHI